MFEALHHGKKAFLSGEHLIVDKNTHTVQTVHKLSDVLDMSKSVTKNNHRRYYWLLWITEFPVKFQILTFHG